MISESISAQADRLSRKSTDDRAFLKFQQKTAESFKMSAPEPKRGNRP
jgi:hypothetical protein